VLTMQEEPAFAREALRAGALGYVLKEAADDELVEAVRNAAVGESYLNPRLGARIASEPPPGPPDDLSEREVQVLRLIALGHTNAEIAEQLMDFFSGLAETNHKSRLRQYVRSIAAGKGKNSQRLAVFGLRPDPAVQSRRSFHVVVKHIAAGIEDASHSVEIAAKIRRQHFHARTGQGLPHLAHGLRKMRGTSVVKIVAIHAGDHDVSKAHHRGHASNVLRLVPIQPHVHLPRVSLRNRTEAAAARAKIAKNHERRRAAVKALVNIGTTRGFTDGVKIPGAQFPLQRMQRLEVRRAFPGPFGQPRRLSGNLNEPAHLATMESKPAARSFCLESARDDIS